jgi:hypothetical protein
MRFQRFSRSLEPRANATENKKHLLSENKQREISHACPGRLPQTFAYSS